MYKIKLPNFEGPFDLLLYFIQRDELNIYDIPIAKITEEYLKYIRLMKFFDLELAGEFLVMVATLMYIKTQMLLPRIKGSDSEEPEDPRTILVQKLIEYKQFKEVSRDLRKMEDNQRYIFYRNLMSNQDNLKSDEEIYYENSSLFDLLRAFKIALEKAGSRINEHIVNIHPVSVSEKVRYIMKRLKTEKKIRFFNLIQNENRRNIIITFLAVLSMMKDKIIIILQDKIYSDLTIFERNYTEDDKEFNEIN
jgi:segregation and condensation protein A